MSELGILVRRLRKAKGLTHVALANRCGVGPSLIMGIEQQRRRYINQRQILAIARGLEVDPEELWATVPTNDREAPYIALEPIQTA